MSARAGVVLAIGVLGGGAALAVDDAQLGQCAAMADPGARLACYDALAGRPAASAEDNFGLASRPAPALPMPDKIEARLAGQVTKFARGMVLRLDNGQAWKLIGDDNAYYRDMPDNAEVVITKGFMGTYWLEIGAINRRFKVRRLE